MAGNPPSGTVAFLSLEVDSRTSMTPRIAEGRETQNPAGSWAKRAAVRSMGCSEPIRSRTAEAYRRQVVELRIVARVQTHPTNQLFRYDVFPVPPEPNLRLCARHTRWLALRRSNEPFPAIDTTVVASEDIRRHAAIWRKLPQSASDSARNCIGMRHGPGLRNGLERAAKGHQYTVGGIRLQSQARHRGENGGGCGHTWLGRGS